MNEKNDTLKKDWLKQIKLKVNEVEQPAPPDIWCRIEKSLGLKEKRNVIPLWRYMAAVVAAVIALLIIFLPFKKEDSLNLVPEEYVAFEKQKSIVISKETSPIVENAIAEVIINSSKEGVRESIIQSKKTEQSNIEEDVSQGDDEVLKEEGQMEAIQSETEKFIRNREQAPIDKDVSGKENPYGLYELYEGGTQYGERIIYTSKKPTFAFNLSSNSFSFSGSNLNSFDDLMESEFRNFEIDSDMHVVNNNSVKVVSSEYLNNFRETEEGYEYKHKEPIKVGLSVRYLLIPQLALEAGLTYSYLESKLYGSPIPIEGVQKLHYLGIPIKVQWLPIRLPKFDFYLSSGIELEKCVYGMVFNDKIHSLPYQFSFTGGVGGQYHITRKLGIYVEPSYIHFFDDRSSIQSIRKEKPDNIELKIGFRFTY